VLTLCNGLTILEGVNINQTLLIMFTRKQYEQIAEVIKDNQNHKQVKNAVSNITLELCTMFEKDNPRFNREKFLKASGLIK